MENRITVENALEFTAENLKKISVPVAMTEQIAVPIANAIRNLDECIRAIREAKVQEEPQEDEAPEIEVLEPEA